MKESISGHTSSLALIADPVEHSFSPALHNASFEELGIDAVYLAFKVEGTALHRAVRGMARLGFVGYNVGAPHKSTILPHLDEVSDEARLMDAVNTVVIREGRSFGYNTDGLSFTKTLADHNIPLHGLHLVMVDIDAEGSAYVTQAASEGAQHVTVLTEASSVDALKTRYVRVSEATGATIEVFDLTDVDRFGTFVADAAVVCNASRIGASPNENRTPIPASLLHTDLCVLDSLYQPRVTTLMQDAMRYGCEVVGGLELLLNQAALAEKLWFDCEMPTKHIRNTFFR